MVGAPERLVFEGAPELVWPLVQDAESRVPKFRDGNALDTIAACPPLSILERVHLNSLRAREIERLKPESVRIRNEFINVQMDKITKRTGISPQSAMHIVTRWCNGILLPDVVLPFDDAEFSGCTVADVLANPERFDGATLADPLEGVEYGTCKAKIMRRADGTPWVHSFAHGRVIYELRYDTAAINAALANVPDDQAADLFVSMALHGDLTEHDTETLRNAVAARCGIGRRALAATHKQARKERDQQQRDEKQQARVANRQDPRPQVQVPKDDAPWIPQMGLISDVLGNVDLAEPPTRNIEGECSRLKMRSMPSLHLLSSETNNADENADTSFLPAPEQLCLVRMSEMEVAETIERYVDYVAEDGRSVHLPAPFVKHFIKREDALPTAVAIAQLPIVLDNGEILAMQGLDRDRGIFFRIPEELMKVLPEREDCTTEAVAEAMRFLCDDWLCDVSTDYVGKCVLIADALTLIERNLLDNRPAIFITAGRRGGGKTTTLNMIVMAVLGIRAAAAAWSTNEEERRKAILAYFEQGPAFLIWDNIARGTQISCTHIERSCTTALYTDRRLGVTEMVVTAAATVHHFTGNNIGPKGDLASRSLSVRLEVDRADPENRTFKHTDPIGWTEAHRGEILAALYTVLLGNPFLRTPAKTQGKTRFKIWWRVVGSAVENAAAQHHAIDADKAATIDFRDLFLSQEDDDEDSSSLADMLDGMISKWTDGGAFKAAEVAALINGQIGQYAGAEDLQLGTTIREFLFPSAAAGNTVSPKAVGKQLKRHLGEPVRKGDSTLILQMRPDLHTKALTYFVESR
jgi:hypothetical protein